MNSFPPIAEYGFLSDCEVNALVAPDGSVEWMCIPRPDSPSVFGALLDRSAGAFRFGPSNAGVPSQRLYVPGTNVLETIWHTPTGWMTVRDLLVLAPTAANERLEGYRRAPGDFVSQRTLLRIATCDSGRVEVELNCLPLFEYGSVGGVWSYDSKGYDSMTCRSPAGDVKLDLTASLRLDATGTRCYARHGLEQGQSAFVALSWGATSPTTDEEALHQLDETIRFWRDWLSRASIADHRWRPYIERSALTLKGLSYAPTGAIIAAATTSLPETLGGERNWDYRYTWIRDSAFMLRSLYELGFDWEAFQYFSFIVDAVTRCDVTNPFELQIMYGIGAERELTESTLDHLSGYCDSRPVRIGNDAYNQKQHDVWGMILESVRTHLSHGATQPPRVWEGLASFVEEAIAHWHEPDQGIWEVRGEPKHFTVSKVMCWLATDRGAGLAREREDTERAERWQAVADEIRAEVCEKGVDDRGVFRQHYETNDLDASLLLIPILGFLPAEDPRVKATVLAVADELTADGLVLRYRVDETDTGFFGNEGTFTICSFWLVSALTLIGEVERAHALCQKLLSLAGPLLLYAEEIDNATGQHLGNFPQAFTHLALIDAVVRLIRAGKT